MSGETKEQRRYLIARKQEADRRGISVEEVEAGREAQRKAAAESRYAEMRKSYAAFYEIPESEAEAHAAARFSYDDDE